ncbi:double-stranded RNA binding motif domain-containing protein, partial [Aerococcus mictus]
GPDHARVFTAVASMVGREWGSGEGSSQKNARHAAAEASYRILADLIEKGEAKPAAGGNGNNGAGGNDGAAPGAGASATPGAAE